MPRSLWLDSAGAPAPCAALEGSTEADLVVVGGGLSGLWAAIQAKEDKPSRNVVLLEAKTIASGATGHSGGFIVSSLTHGVGNGLARFADEMPMLERLGRENFDQTIAALERYGVDCDLELGGEMTVALEPHEEEWLAHEAEELRRLGHDAVLLDAEAVRAEVRSPLYRAGLWQRSGAGILDPAKLAWGLKRVARELGVRVFEGSRLARLQRAGAGLQVSTARGRVSTRGAVLTTGAFRSPVRAVRRRIVPVWDYVLVSEPLDAARRASLGWANRQGIGDAGNQFHYYRLTADDRIVWGGYDAVYKFGNGVGPQLRQREATFARLAQHFFTIFPQLGDLRFTHRWGGPIDTCSRFSAFFGTSHRGRGRIRRRAHRPGDRGEPFRRPRRPRPAGGALHGGDPTPLRAHPAGSVPARAGALGRDPADTQPPRGCGPQARSSRTLAAAARPSRTRLRQLDV